MADAKRWRWGVLLCAALIITLGGCTRAKPPRERPPFEGVPTFEMPTTVAEPSPEATPTLAGQPTASPTEAATSPAPATLAPQPTLTATLSQPATATPPAPATATPPAAPSATTVPPGDPDTETVYVVQPGDTVLSIAERFGILAADLMFRNGLRDPSALAVGQALIVPLAAAPGTGGPVKTIQHRVMPGETLYRIALLYNSTVEEILAWNPNVKSPERLVSGSYLIVPVGAAGRARAHTVRPGETLAAIAAQYGVTVNALLKVNNLSNPNLIYAGQLLIIPE
jgi:LysM repeat protein